MVYNQLHPTQFHCTTCGLSLKHSKTKLCPDPVRIGMYLTEKDGFEGTIEANDKICYSCYKYHLFILKQHEKTSTQISLEELVTTVEQKIPAMTIKTTSDLIEVSINKVVAAVGHELLQGNALLLPELHNWFSGFANEELHNLEEREEVNTSKLVTSAYILSNLVAILQHHLTYTCVTRKYGTLLYRSGIDLTQPLARALSKARQNHRVQPSSNCQPLSIQETEKQEEMARMKVLEDLNLRAIKHITRS